MAERKGYSFRSHTADVELVAHGSTIEEAFSNAALALFDTSADVAKLARLKGNAKKLGIRDKASTIEDLLWVTLQDTLSLGDAKGIYCYKVDKMSIKKGKNDYTVAAEFSGRKEDQKYSNIYVKGVSHFDLSVAKRGNKFISRAVLDV